MAHQINRPKRWPGPPAEAEANRATHLWDDGWCNRCGCRDRHIHAEWPCGATVPREVLTIDDDTPEDAEPVTDEFEPETITIFTHPRLLVEGDDYGVQLRSTAGGATVRLSPYEAAKLTRALDRHLGSRDSSA